MWLLSNKKLLGSSFKLVKILIKMKIIFLFIDLLSEDRNIARVVYIENQKCDQRWPHDKKSLVIDTNMSHDGW